MIPRWAAALPPLLAAIYIASCAPDRGHLLDSISSFLSYYKNSPDLVDPNLVFGVLIVKGEVGRLAKTDNEKELEEVNGVLRLCDTILAKHPYDWSISPYAEQFVTSLMKKPQIKSLSLQGVPPTYELENALEQGSPTRAESDTCLLGLLIDGVVAEGCETLERDPNARGYTLLHQGIYFTIKSHLKIDEAAALEEIRRICGRMLGENRQIRRLGFPSTLQDLFVEQVAVCGVNKFSEFLTDGTVRMIQSLQTSRGCFSMIEKGSRLSIDCYNHLSSVAAAAIATFLSA